MNRRRRRLRPSLRTRIVAAATAAVAVSLALASLATYLLASDEARARVDESLETRLEEATRGPSVVVPGVAVDGGDSDVEGFVFLPVTSPPVPALPVDAGEFGLPPLPGAEAVAAGNRSRLWGSMTVASTRFRVLVVNVRPGLALQVARSVEEVDAYLRALALQLLAVGGLGVIVALGLGALVARASLRPVRALEGAVERAAAAEDLSGRVPAAGDDEVGRLGRQVNALLESLDRSVQAQRQLVADASHELRSPLTSLRTNVEVLTEPEGLTPKERRALVGDVVEQVAELTRLLDDLTVLAEPAAARGPAEDLALDAIVHEAVARVRPRARTRAIAVESELEPWQCRAWGSEIDRAIVNLLDNAIEWSPLGATVQVRLSQGVLVVRDCGPGFDHDDLPFVFDRFFRSGAARDRPGSGLGLAIVAKVARDHGGSVAAANDPSGGAVVRLRFPGRAAGDRTRGRASPGHPTALPPPAGP